MPENETTSKVLRVLRQIMRAVDLHSKKLEKEYNLTGPQLIVLHEIVRNQEIPIGILAQKVSLSNATLTGIIDRLENRGLVNRVRNIEDRRKVLIKSTKTGEKTLKNAPSPLQEEFRRQFEKLRIFKQKEILASLEMVASMMSAESLDVAPMLTGQSLQLERKNRRLKRAPANRKQ
ncbi:MAG: MarR family transcriptional regulator [candidate division Zixibacteria bacterium]|nr:MarR family transcriptional regulator [candidate division Zixibacteria bacterium]